ncbi:MAG: DUF2283 domain-containing protein [Patescibacteria group bacterium]
MKIDYDKVADAVYVRLKDCKIKKTIRITDRLMIDIDDTGATVGIEILDASSEQGLKDLEKKAKDGIPINVISSTPVVA